MQFLQFIIRWFGFLVTIHGFRTGLPIRSMRHMSKSSIHMSEMSDVAKYNNAKQQIRASISSSFAKGVPDQFKSLMNNFLEEYGQSYLEAKQDPQDFKTNVMAFFQCVKEAVEKPHKFSPHHKAIRSPFDYYQWGNDFLRPLIVSEQSRLLGRENAISIQKKIDAGDNVLILSNHQTEADPQVLSILLEREGLSALAEKIIFIAGHKVTSDPVAIPFSMGRNLLCIHSKKHIRNPPEDAQKKQTQNIEAMNAMGKLAKEGGNVFWVAPSGGRDRPNPVTGEFTVAPFDAKTLDMFKIIAAQSGRPMHFFPMAMYTHQLIPPPKSVSSSVGEERSGKRGPVSVHFLDETAGIGGLKDMEFCQRVQGRVEEAYKAAAAWHDQQQKV